MCGVIIASLLTSISVVHWRAEIAQESAKYALNLDAANMVSRREVVANRVLHFC